MKPAVKIAIAAAVGGAGYFLWKNWGSWFGAKDDDAPKGGDTTTTSTTPGKNGEPSDYEKSVGVLQELLGIAVDMKPGKQTNGKLEELFSVSGEPYNAEKSLSSGYPNLKKYGKGVVGPENVAWYVERVKNKWTPKDLTPYRRIGEQLKLSKTGWFKRDIELPLVVGTGGTGYKLTGGYANIPKGQSYELANWSWENATLYARINVGGIARIVQVYGMNLDALSTDNRQQPRPLRPTILNYGQKI